MIRPVLILAILVLLLAAWLFRDTEYRDPEPPPFPERIEVIGTNRLDMGTHIFVPVSKTYHGQVAGMDANHRFEDGSTRPAVQIKRGLGATWVPRDKVNRMVRPVEE